MKFVMFDHPTSEGVTPIAINSAHIHAVVAAVGPNGRDGRASALLTSHASDEGIGVVGSVADVVAALEAATAPPAPAPVVVEPSDLEIAAKVLDEVARVALTGGVSFEPDVGAIDRALGLDSPKWDDTSDALTALANRLRRLAR